MQLSFIDFNIWISHFLFLFWKREKKERKNNLGGEGIEVKSCQQDTNIFRQATERNKKMMWKGDSIILNDWESFPCSENSIC